MTQVKNETNNFKPGEHPHSQANLNREGRPKDYGADKKQHYLSVTEEGWEGAQAAVKAAGLKSVSDLIEKLGRDQLVIVDEHLVDMHSRVEYSPQDRILISDLQSKIANYTAQFEIIQNLIGKAIAKP